MSDDNSEKGKLVNINVPLKELAPVINNFVDKLARGAGVVYEPVRIVAAAKATASAAEIIRKVGDLDDRQTRMLNRIVREGETHQENMERIAFNAQEDLKPDAKPENIEDDWLSDFFQKARNISDQEMSGLWSRVLAEEANTPGAFSKRTVATLYEMSKSDANLFTTLSGYMLNESGSPFIFRKHPPEGCPSYLSLSHLDAIGLIRFNSLVGFVNKDAPETVVFQFPTGILIGHKPRNEDGKVELKLGDVIFTETGKQLYKIAGAAPHGEMMEYVKHRLEAQGFEVGIKSQ